MKLTQTVLLFIVAIVVCAGSVVADQPPDSVAGRDTVGVTAAGQAEELAAESPPERQAEEQPPDAFDFLLTGKYLGFLFLMVAGLILVLGRWVNTWVRVVMMLAAFVLFGLDYFFPLHPSPMCGFTKLFMFRLSHGVFFPAFIAMFAAMIIPNLIGKKLYCGWVCPLGALQELVNKVPFRYRWRQFNFTAFNSVRMFLLVMFFLTLFLVSEQIGVYNIYQPINFFELLHWSIDTLFVVMLVVLVIASLVIYRPFCHLICPIGALAWLSGFVAPGKIRVDHARCDDCMECVEKSPCAAISKLIDETTVAAPDCTSCGECLNTCPRDAIKFSFKK